MGLRQRLHCSYFYEEKRPDPTKRKLEKAVVTTKAQPTNFLKLLIRIRLN